MSDRTPTATPSDRPRSDFAQEARHRDDQELVARCVEGCTKSWQALVERHERTIYFAVLNTLRAYGARATADRVEDIQADLVVELVKDDFRRLRKYSGRCKLDHWLKVVAGNYTIDLLRRERPTVSLDADTEAAMSLRRSLPSAAAPPDVRIHRREIKAALWDMVAELPEEDRRFVDLFCREEKSFEEIAILMETTVGAIYARKNRVRKKLLRLADERGFQTVA